tara:strand:- start:204 stop:638 length:435 start_codon:yes stop_codon:yes gene_type:complete
MKRNYSFELTKERDDKIKSEICRRYDVSWISIESKSRVRLVVDARRMYCGILRNTFGITYTKIANILNKNHATILHNVNQHDNFVKILKSYRLNFEEIEAILIEDDNYYIHEIANIERKIDELYKKLDDLLEKKEQYKSKLINK